MIFCGQTPTHAPQATQFSLLTLATPSTTPIASNWHASAQSPSPMHPNMQALGEVNHPFAPLQELMPCHSSTVREASHVPLHITFATIGSAEPADLPRISAI